MANYLGMLEKKELISISNDFNYLEMTKDFIGLKLFPMVKTENMKLAVLELTKNGKIPVMALVHALDTEARIGDRPNIKEVQYELFLVKEKLNQGEALRKLLKEGFLSNEKAKIVNQVFADAQNLIMRVLTRAEVMACEVISTGKLTINENNVTANIDFGLKEDHLFTFSGWDTPSHDIIGDLAAAQTRAKHKIRYAVTTSKIIGYMTKNEGIALIANKADKVPTLPYILDFVKMNFGFDIIVYDGTYGLSALDDTQYPFLKQDVITFVCTDEVIGRTFFTSTPEEDMGIADAVQGMVAVTQNADWDPAALWTKASAVIFPCPTDVNLLFIGTVNA